MASLRSHGCPLILGKEQIQAHVIRYPKTRVRISKHVCLRINFQKNAVLGQMCINFQDYNNHSLWGTSTFKFSSSKCRFNPQMPYNGRGGERPPVLLAISWTNFGKGCPGLPIFLQDCEHHAVNIIIFEHTPLLK